jgi:hypothetical protein
VGDLRRSHIVSPAVKSAALAAGSAVLAVGPATLVAASAALVTGSATFAAGSARRVIAFSTSLMLAAKKLDSDRVRDTRASTADVLDDIALVFPELLPTTPIISELLRTCPQCYPAQSVPKYHIAFST